MANFYDLAYWAGVGAAAPYWLLKGSARRKVLTALRQRRGRVTPRQGDAPAVLIHAVSLGEMNATRSLVDKLSQARPELQFILSTTTQTGYARGTALYGDNPRVQIIRYPLDFSAAVRRVLEGLRPNVVVLMELEVWPNFIAQCARRGIPVLLINGRLTDKSFHNYRRAKVFVRGMFRKLARICAQEEIYARRFVELGAVPQRVEVTGTMKFDTATISARVEGDAALAREVGLKDGERIWVCGSSGPGEERLILETYHELLKRFTDLRLVIVPRKPERFDEVAELIRGQGFPLLRRSKPATDQEASGGPPVILGDTMGELRKFYALAEVVFVGRTLLDLGPRQHGSDMIEPAALGKPVIVGPFTGNFTEPMNQFRHKQALVEIGDATGLREALAGLLEGSKGATAMGHRAQEVVRQHQGATNRHVVAILQALEGATHDH